MLRTISLTILLTVVLGVFAVAPAAASKKPKDKPVTCGDIITTPGNYFLAGNCTGPGIQILASKVTLKLNGHTMSGGAGFADLAGVYVRDASKVKILGPGTLRDYEVGVYFTYDVIGVGVSDSEVEKVSCINNFYGMYWDGAIDSEIVKSVMSDNFYGLFLDGFSRDNEIEENKVKNNLGVGIYIRPGITGNEVEENTVLGNDFLDLQDDNPDCDDNEWEDNRFDTANQDCID